MKKQLPRLVQSSRGFTLVELLVVISIIAILATISVSVFSGAQGSARDGRRRSEISSISKSIEAAKDYQSGLYKYDTATAQADFPRGVPYADPQSIVYCIGVSTSTTTSPANLTTNWTSTSSCPSMTGASSTGTLQSMISSAGNALFDGTAKSWTLCAALERGTQPYCISSLTPH